MEACLGIFFGLFVIVTLINASEQAKIKKRLSELERQFGIKR